MNEPIEVELPWAPFYCFEPPVYSFVLLNGFLDHCTQPMSNMKEIPFPTAIHMMDTEINWAQVGTIRDLIQNGHSAKAQQCHSGIVLAFGQRRTIEKENKTNDIMSHKLITMDMSAQVNAFLVLLDAKRIITQAQHASQTKKPLSPRSIRRWRQYEQHKKRDYSARDKCLQKIKQLWSNMKQNGFDVKL